MTDRGNNSRRRLLSFLRRSMQISGQQKGDIHSVEPVTILDGAFVTGNIVAPRIVVAGLLHGTAVTHHLIIKSGGQIWGDVLVSKLQIEPGGKIQGWAGTLEPGTPLPDPNGAELQQQFETQLDERVGATFVDIETLTQALTEAQAQLTDLQQQLEAAQTTLATRADQIEAQAAALQTAKNEAEAALAARQQQIDALEEQTQELAAALQNNRQQAAEQEDALLHWQELAEKSRLRLETLEEEQESWQRLLEESVLVTGKLREKNKLLEFEWQQTITELNELRNQVPDVSIEEMEFALADANQQIATLNHIVAEARQAAAESDEQLLWHKANLKTTQRTLAQSRQAVESLQTELADQNQQFADEKKKLKQALRHKSSQVEAHEAEIEHHLQQMAAQGRRLAEIQADLIERELELAQAERKIEQQSDLIKRMKQVTSSYIQELEARLGIKQTGE